VGTLPGVDLLTALAAARDNRQAVLVTLKADGRPQLSNVLQWTDAAGLVRISITTSRAKYANLRRTPWGAVHVDVGSFWSYAVLEGPVELSEPATDPHDATVEELVDLYRALSGEHPDWDDYRRAQVSEGRVVVRLTPDHAYGMVR
jgi:PPOX class probable F420-dependent enzyme